ncbi:MAG: sulfatase [Cyanobacteria bacterium SID2]|nr:sulfatase [Cyanobacteria bacterium SID2]MBP0006722.1 sulfatase [Cyanobacteria bacterium SBC]
MGVSTNLVPGCGRQEEDSQLTGSGVTQQKLNVLAIIVDDLRPQLKCYGREQMISPHLDRLAAEGMLFERAYCQVPICGASRASTLSGVRPTWERFGSNYKARKDKDFPEGISLPGIFKQHGYRTISYGKVYHTLDDDRDSWIEGPWRPWGMWGQNAYVKPENQAIAATREGAYGPPVEMADVADNVYADGKIAERTVETLDRLKDKPKPFFLAVGFFKPHLPFNAPKKYWDLYDRDDINLADNPFRPAGAPNAALHNWGELRAYDGIPKEGPVSEDMARTLIHGYYACTSYIDAQIGTVLDALDQFGLRDHTIVVLWGDHGWQLGEHGLWCKHANFETSLHSPLLVRAPGFPEGQRTAALVEFVDIYPSLCELCGIELPEYLEGSSFVPLLDDPERPWKEAAFSRYQRGESIKVDRYRYTEWRNDPEEIRATMLYDHVADLGENTNIADRPENAELVRKLSEQLKQGWRAFRPPT